MTGHEKCRDCKWLTGKRSSIGIECMQPDNQKKWNEKEEVRRRANIYFVKVVARYRQPSAKACKRFEGREE